MTGTDQHKWLIYFISHTWKKTHRITYDSDKKYAFLVHKKPGITKFKANLEGLYAFKPPTSYLKEVSENKNMSPSSNVNGMELSHMISTVKYNIMGYTQRQFERDKQSRRLYNIIENPAVDNYNYILGQNIIKNCPVTIYDVNLADIIFGIDIVAL